MRAGTDNEAIQPAHAQEWSVMILWLSFKRNFSLTSLVYGGGGKTLIINEPQRMVPSLI